MFSISVKTHIGILIKLHCLGQRVGRPGARVHRVQPGVLLHDGRPGDCVLGMKPEAWVPEGLPDAGACVVPGSLEMSLVLSLGLA